MARWEIKYVWCLTWFALAGAARAQGTQPAPSSESKEAVRSYVAELDHFANVARIQVSATDIEQELKKLADLYAAAAKTAADEPGVTAALKQPLDLYARALRIAQSQIRLQILSNDDRLPRSLRAELKEVDQQQDDYFWSTIHQADQDTRAIVRSLEDAGVPLHDKNDPFAP